LNRDPGASVDPGQQAPQVRRGERDAACRGRQSRAGDVNEYRAAASRDSRSRIMVDLDHEIVEMVVAPQPVTRRGARQSHRAVVSAVAPVLAPGVASADPPDGQRRARPRAAIGTPPQPDRPECPARRRAVAFAFVGANARVPKGHGAARRPGNQPAPDARPGACPYPYHFQKRSGHGRPPVAERRNLPDCRKISSEGCQNCLTGATLITIACSRPNAGTRW
jgi:hypothetical protein